MSRHICIYIIKINKSVSRCIPHTAEAKTLGANNIFITEEELKKDECREDAIST